MGSYFNWRFDRVYVQKCVETKQNDGWDAFKLFQTVTEELLYRLQLFSWPHIMQKFRGDLSNIGVSGLISICSTKNSDIVHTYIHNSLLQPFHLVKTLRVNKIDMKSFPNISCSQSILYCRSPRHSCIKLTHTTYVSGGLIKSQCLASSTIVASCSILKY